MTCNCKNYISPCSQVTQKCFKNFWAFESLSPTQLNELKRVGVRKKVNKGDPLFLQGDPSNEMFLIKSGKVKLNKVSEEGKEITLDFRQAGDIIGETLFSEETDYPLSAWAIEDTLTCGLQQNTFNQLILKFPEIALKIIQSMSAKVISMTNRLESMSESSLEEKLFQTLINIGKDHGTQIPEGLIIGLPLTHEELSFLVGAHRVSVTKAIKVLIDKGRLKKSGKTFILCDFFS